MEDTAQMAPAAPEVAAPSQPAAPQAKAATLAPPQALALSNDWRSILPDDLRNSPSLAKFKDPADLAKSYLNLQTAIGRKGVIPPKPDDPKEVHEAFRKALGVPDAPDGYKIERPQDIPEDIWDPEGAQWFAGVAHEAGLTPQQAQALATAFAKRTAEQVAARTDPVALDMELAREWGAQKDRNIELAKRAARQLAHDMPEVLDALERKVGGANLVKLFYRIATSGGIEETVVGMGRDGGKMSPYDVQAEITRLTSDIDGPYWNTAHPEHEMAVQRVLELREALTKLSR